MSPNDLSLPISESAIQILMLAATVLWPQGGGEEGETGEEMVGGEGEGGGE